MRGFGDISRSAIVLSVRRCHTATRDTVGTGAATWFLRFSWCVLGYSIAAIIFGAFVRATGSGAGCGSHWPLCNGAIVPHTARMETLIEFTHRVTSVLSLFLVVALACWAWRLYPSGFRIRRSAGTALILILIEAGIGAWLVLSGLMKGNDSVARAVSTMGHLVNTYFLLAALALTSWWAGNEDSAAVPGPRGRIWPLALAWAGTLLLSASGAIAALGDTLYPAQNLLEGLRQEFSTANPYLVRLRVLHPFIAVGLSAYLGFLCWSLMRRDPRAGTRRLAGILLTLLCLQLAFGVLNVALLAPVWLQLTHLLFSALIWVMLVLLSASRQGGPNPVRI